MPRNKAPASGVICLDGTVITYVSRLFGSFSLSIADIAVVGEFTADTGPFVDDWFIVFVRRGGDWFEASVYSDGFDALRNGLSLAIGADVHCCLADSTNFASRVVWPEAISGHPLFDSKLVSCADFLRSLKLSILPETRRCLALEVLAAVEGG